MLKVLGETGSSRVVIWPMRKTDQGTPQPSQDSLPWAGKEYRAVVQSVWAGQSDADQAVFATGGEINPPISKMGEKIVRKNPEQDRGVEKAA